MLAAIPYETFETIALGPLQLRTFGLMLGIGVLAGAWVAGRHGEQFGVDREATYALATRMVIAGVIGARLTWAITNWDQIEEPLDVIAVWQGGLQFSGGFIAALIVGYPTFRRWDRLTRWRMADAGAFGVTVGAALGRVGCTAVGEHFGSTWGAEWFPLAVRFEGGDPRENFLGDQPLTVGTEFHNLAINEMIVLFVLALVLWRVLSARPAPAPGTAVAIFLPVYALNRFLLDFLRINDRTVLGLTGAQYMCLGIFIASVWMWRNVRPKTAALVVAEAEARASSDPSTATKASETEPAAELADAHATDVPDTGADDPASDGAPARQTGATSSERVVPRDR